MKFTIKKRFTDEIIVEQEAESLKEVVEKNKADLREADLRGADLQEAKILTSQKDDLLKSLGVIIN